MIACREDLHNTWVDVTKDHGVVKLFVSIYDKDALFGDEIPKPYNEMSNGISCAAISIDSRGGWAKHTGKPFHPTLREVTMADFIPSNDVKYYDKDEEIKPQDGFVSNAINNLKISHKLKTKEELMIDNKEDYIGLTGNHQMNCILNDTQSKVRVLLKRIKHHDDDVDSLVDRVRFIEELVDMAIDGTVVESSEKPRIKTEYVKVTESIFDLRDEFESGNLYVNLLGNSNQYAEIEEELTLIDEIKDDNVYRKVEKQITWHDDVIDYLESFGGDECKTFIEAIMGNKNAGVNGNHYVGFINMCKLVVDGVNGK